MSFINWGEETPEQKAIRARLEEQALYEQAVRFARSRSGNNFAGVGGSAASTPQAKQVSGKDFFVLYDNVETGMKEVIVLDYTNGVISQPAEVGVSVDADYYFYEVIRDKGFVLFGESSNEGELGMWAAFVDAGGNVIKTIKNTKAGNWSSRSNEGTSITLSYAVGGTDAWDSDENKSVICYWWMGDKVFNKTFKDVQSEAYIYTNWFSGYDSLDDGTTTVYYDDSNEEKVWVLNAEGKAIDITEYASDPYRSWSDSAFNNGFWILGTYDKKGTGLYDYFTVIKKDGTVYTHDISTYSANNIERDPYGSGKYSFLAKPDNSSIDRTVIAYNINTNTIVTASYSQTTYSNRYWIYRDSIGNSENEYGSPAGNEHLWIAARSGNSTYEEDQDSYRYDDVKFMCLFDGETSFIEAEYQNFLFIDSYRDASKTPTLFCNRDGNTKLEMIVAAKTGYIFSDTGSNIATTQDYFEVIACGDYTITSHNDSAQDPTRRSFAIWKDGSKKDDIWVSTDNGWRYNWNTFFVQETGDTTYYFTPLSPNESWVTFEDDGFSNYIISNYNDSWDYVDNHLDGTTALDFGSNNYALLTSDTVSFSSTFAVVGSSNKYYIKDHIIAMFNDTGNSNTFTIKIYDKTGLIHTVPVCPNGNFSQSYIVDERITIKEYNGDLSAYVYHMIRLDGTIVSSTPVPDTNQYYGINDWRWFSY